MKKNGFTLAELIITLSIIGVVAALAAPAIVNIMPYREKFVALDYYNKLNQATESILDVKKGYCLEKDVEGVTEDGENYGDGIPDCIGLECLSQKTYAEYLAQELGGDYKDNQITFPDGVRVQAKNVEYPSGRLKCIVLTLKLAPDESLCMVDDEECKNPNMFEIRVSPDGTFGPADYMMDVFLKTSSETTNKKEAISDAKVLKSENSDKDKYYNIEGRSIKEGVVSDYSFSE